MSSKIPILPAKEVVRILQKLGFIKISQKGSHAKYKNYVTNQIVVICTKE